MNIEYSSWCLENELPFDSCVIRDIFDKLGSIFGFQNDNINNMFDFFMFQLDSRASRMLCLNALLSLHADYIGGNNANYKKWVFSTQYPLSSKFKNNHSNLGENDTSNVTDISKSNKRWNEQISKLSKLDYVAQIALYLLIWGEANNVRFLPECICFLYHMAYQYYTLQDTHEGTLLPEFWFLDNIITPIYNFLFKQLQRIECEKDHSQIIGYDDVNELFWTSNGINQIRLLDGTNLNKVASPTDCFLSISKIDWDETFKKHGKSYKERRTWLHVIVNYSRIWIIHITVYWYYVSLNSPTLYTKNYFQMLDNQPPLQVRWTIASLGGAIACLLQLFATIIEVSLFKPYEHNGCKYFAKSLILVLIIIAIISPSVYLLCYIPLNAFSITGFRISIGQFVFSVAAFIYLSITPPYALFFLQEAEYSRSAFTRAFPTLASTRKFYSVLFWLIIFAAKFTESYFFLVLSLKDPIRILSIMEMKRCNSIGFPLNDILCKQQSRILLGLMYLADMVLFFLDTYLWYIICNCVFSIILSFSTGLSIFAPWKNIFIRMPQRISTKLIKIGKTEVLDNNIVLASEIWNAIVISMYREHILSIDQVSRLVYEKIDDVNLVRSPIFFVFQDDNTSSMRIRDFFNPGDESGRRISFFAQSISATIPEPFPTIAMPTFTVLIPHYSEKILLNLREIIKEDSNSKMSLLEYLKAMKPLDWENFVKDTKILSTFHQDQATHNGETTESSTLYKWNEDYANDKNNDLPLYCLGFKNSSQEYLNRTRIWASLRSQTLYRTISGFMNYLKAITLLHYSETAAGYSNDYENEEYDQLVDRKFKLIVAMQRFQDFTDEEKEDAKILFAAYPNMMVTYVEREEKASGDSYFSCLIELDEFGECTTKYRVKLSGYPILGDGKLDNQNHSIIFYRGEYIQVIDANQDNYLEECLKIKAVLSEFEEMSYEDLLGPQYQLGVDFATISLRKSPVAIVGAREYIYSENFGVMGDIAASKEQTFGTLFARTLADIGGKLHYGHPDFMNGIFMTTRGGISKGQRGLHLNEDIYAGMMALLRGGRIKHCDYFQCGKGRDMGFHSILNFTAKIGAGMGEQILSREHYYLGTQLPLDRFLSFFYAHPGFHLNNLFILLSVEMIMLILVNLGALVNESIICDNLKDGGKFTDLEQPLGCYNLKPVLKWVNRYIWSVFFCFFLSFIPLFLQDFIEKGPIKACLRIISHLASFSPIFEVFICQIYAKSLRDNLTFGGAKYIATGRNLSISRISYSTLYSRYATISIYSGANLFLKLLFATITIWQPSLLWFWMSVISLCVAPLLFNPHQFCWKDFFIDYRDLLRWLSRGNTKRHQNSWIEFTRSNRSRLTGFKRSKAIKVANIRSKFINRASRWNVFVDRFFVPSIGTIFVLIPYLFINSQNGVRNPKGNIQVALRLGILFMLPAALNAIVILFIFAISSLLGPIFRLTCCKRTGGVVAITAHIFLVVITLLSAASMFVLQGGNISRALLGVICILSMKRIAISLVETVLSRELRSNISNRIWWSGSWWTRDSDDEDEESLGFWSTVSQIFREFIVKIIEMELFSYDFILSHFILLIVTPLLFVPFIDKIHSKVLFWSTNKALKRVYLMKEKRRRKNIVWLYCFIYFAVQLIFAAIIGGVILSSLNYSSIDKFLMKTIPVLKTPLISQLFQPNHQDNNDTGKNAPSYILRSPPDLKPMRTIS